MGGVWSRGVVYKSFWRPRFRNGIDVRALSEDRAFQDFSWIQGCRPLDLREFIAFLSYIYISRN